MISAWAWAAPCRSIEFDVEESIISRTNLKLSSASFIPILAEILPIAIEAILLISGRGSQREILIPVMMIFR